MSQLAYIYAIPVTRYRFRKTSQRQRDQHQHLLPYSQKMYSYNSRLPGATKERLVTGYMDNRRMPVPGLERAG